MIKIIKGIYGYKTADGIIEPKSSKDDPFALTKEQEARLVSKGVAEYVQSEAPAAEPAPAAEEEPKELTYNEAKKLAKEMGLSTKGTKDEILERIKEAEEAESDTDGEEPPTFSPEEPK